MSFKKENGFDNPAFERNKEDNERSTNKIITKISIEEDGNQIERTQWGNGLEFLMSCIAMSVGLGNIWRFPFTAYENGGGAFLIPYIIVLLVIGRPLYYMEMALGQFSSRGNVKMFGALAPALKGTGWGQTIGVACVATYYCSIMALTLFYLVNSFTANLPWVDCRDEWTTNYIMKDKICIASANKSGTLHNNTISSSELYFRIEVLKEKYDINDGIGLPEWRLTLCLLASWLIVFLASRRGVKTSGKASYFLALFPYVVMAALLIRGCTLEGAGAGILYFIRPQWNKLLDADVWYAAVTQCFFSLNVGFGSIIMYSSYNDFNHNIKRDAFVVSILDTLTSLIAGATIFGILGNLAHELNVDVPHVIKTGGTGLAFISYPEAIAKFDSVPWLFAILFFVMLFVLGIGSLIALQGSVTTVVMDAFPNWKKSHISAGVALAGFLIGLIYVTPGGQFLLNLVDYFGGTFIIFILAIIEVVGVSWIYGLENFCDDVEFMLKSRVTAYFRITWGIVTPLLLIVIFIYFLATMSQLTYGIIEYPTSALVCGWLLVVVTVLQFILWFLYYIYLHRDEGFPETVYKTFSSERWGPKNKVKYEEWKKFKEEKSKDIKRQKKWHKRIPHLIFNY